MIVYDLLASSISVYVDINLNISIHLVTVLQDSLEAGYRGLFIDLCECGDNGVQLCHTVCQAGTRDPKSVFEAVLAFLNANPTEVILVEIQVNKPREILAEFYDVLLQIDGLVDMMYSHPSWPTEWPLMRELVADNKVSTCRQMRWASGVSLFVPWWFV